jgi:hypothetical protein
MRKGGLSAAAQVGDCGYFDSGKISIRNPEVCFCQFNHYIQSFIFITAFITISPFITYHPSSHITFHHHITIFTTTSPYHHLHHYITTSPFSSLIQHHLHHHPYLFSVPHNMASRKTRAQSKTSQSKAAITATAPVESPTTENLSENQQAPSFIVVCPPSGATPENLRVIPPVGEGPSKAPPTRESPTTLPHLKGPSKEQPPTNGPSEDPKPAENLTVTLPTGEAPSKAPPAKEPLTTLPHLESPSKGRPTTETQAGDQQTAENSTTNQQAEKALEDTPASASLPNGQSATDDPTTNLPDGEIPKELRESSSQVQSTSEHPSEDHPVKSLPTRPSSGKQSGKILFRHLPRIL